MTDYYTAPNFHVVYRDKTGKPAINGSVEFFRAADHEEHKAVFEDRDGVTALPNPVTLNAAGVIADITGAPKPVYYADDENYFIVVRDSAGAIVQTVDDWNSNIAFFPVPSINESNLTNYVLNPQFRYVVQPSFISSELPPSVETPIAYEGWFFYRDTSNSTNAINFVEFSPGQTDVPHNPKQYLEFECTIQGAETRKDFGLPLGDVIGFSGLDTSVALWGRSTSGGTSNIQFILRQEFGVGGSSSIDTILDTYELDADWEQFQTLGITVPSVAGKTIEDGNRLVLIVRMPLNAISKLNIINLQLNIGDELFDFNYLTSVEEDNRKKAYQLPDIILDDPDVGSTTYGHAVVGGEIDYDFDDDTGLVEKWLLTEVPKFRLALDGSTYVRTALIPDTPVKYNRLYQKWENDPLYGDGNAFGYGEDGFRPLVYPSTVFITNMNPGSVTSWADNDTGFTITTEQANGSKGFTVDFRESGYTDMEHGRYRNLELLLITNTANGNVTDINAHTSGFTVGVNEQGSGSQPEISHVIVIAASTLGGKYFTVNSTSTAYYVWFKVDGVGADPAVGGHTAILVELLSTDTEVEVASRLKEAMNGSQITKIECNAASTLSGGEYFLGYNVSSDFYFWLTVDGLGTDPVVPLKIGVQIKLTGSDTAAQVAAKVAKTISAYYFVVPDARGWFIRAWDNGAGTDPDTDIRWGSEDNNIYGDLPGTYQNHLLSSHRHKVPTEVRGAAGTERFTPEFTHNENTTYTGGIEDRPINVSYFFTIKY